MAVQALPVLRPARAFVRLNMHRCRNHGDGRQRRGEGLAGQGALLNYQQRIVAGLRFAGEFHRYIAN